MSGWPSRRARMPRSGMHMAEQITISDDSAIFGLALFLLLDSAQVIEVIRSNKQLRRWIQGKVRK